MAVHTRDDLGSGVLKNFQKHLVPLSGSKPLLLFELGVYEGQTAVWFLEHLLDKVCDRYIGVDNWPDYDVEICARTNLTAYQERVVLVKQELTWVAHNMPTIDQRAYDIVYINAAPAPTDLLRIMLSTWGMMRIGGMLVVNSYRTKGRRQNRSAAPAAAGLIAVTKGSGFLAGESEIVWENTQLGLRKIGGRCWVEEGLK
ncbi:class I SAM-dependent methyltransferase [bacterium]|nr:class I SAM-dependent methyltransferase [bacterium]